MDYNDDRTQKLLLGVRSGTDLETSCHYAGLSVQTVLRSLERGKLEEERIDAGAEPDVDESDSLLFWTELKKARAEAIVRNMAVVQTAASNGSWQAATWFLERSAPEQYSRNAADRKSTAVESQRTTREITEG